MLHKFSFPSVYTKYVLKIESHITGTFPSFRYNHVDTLIWLNNYLIPTLGIFQ